MSSTETDNSLWSNISDKLDYAFKDLSLLMSICQSMNENEMDNTVSTIIKEVDDFLIHIKTKQNKLADLLNDE